MSRKRYTMFGHGEGKQEEKKKLVVHFFVEMVDNRNGCTS